MTTRHAVRQTRPASAPLHLRAPNPSTPFGGWAALCVALALWVVGLKLTHLEDIDEWGLLNALPTIWYLALALAAGVSVYALVRRGPVHQPLITAGVGLLLTILYATTTILEDAPRLAWTYKHIAVTRYILDQGSLDPSIDIFQRWPGGFAFGAYLADLLGIDDPTEFAAWAQPFFAAVLALLVYAIARTLSTDLRAAWIAVIIFSCTNYAGQLYYAPQPLALTLSLAICLLVLQFLPGNRKRLSTLVEHKLGRGRADRDAVVRPRLSSSARALVIGLVLLLQFSSTISHQLTPYITVGSILVITVLGCVRPWWLVLAMGVMTVAFLIPNLHYVQDNYALVNSLNPFANFRARAEGVTSQYPVKAVIGALAPAISLVVGLLAIAGVGQRWRRGGGWPAVIVIAMIGSPLLVGLVQNYGGEAQLRAFLFASPWCAVAGGWLLTSLLQRQARWPKLVTAGVVALVLALFVPNFFGNEDVYYIPRSEVQACQWLADNTPPGTVFVQSVPGFPARCTADYYSHVGPSRGDTPNLLSVDKRFAKNDFTTDLPALTGQVYDKVRAYGKNSRLIFSLSQERYARAWGLFGGAAGYERLESAVRNSPQFQLIYENSDTRIYALAIP